MPRKPKYTKEELIDTAVTIIREEGEDSLSARHLVKRLGTAPATIFTHFDSMDDLEEALTEKVRSIYNVYVDRGLKKNPPFKGFAIEHVKFSLDEPNLYTFLFLRPKALGTLSDLIDREGHRERLVVEAMKVFGCTRETAEEVFENLVVYMFGLASMCSKGLCSFTEEELARKFGLAAGGFLYAVKENLPWYSVVPVENGEKVEDSPYLSDK